VISTVLKPIKLADAWLSEPTPNATGRLGLFRILYALFYLWYLATQHTAKISFLPRSYFTNRILLLEGWNFPPSFLSLSIVESIMAAMLVLLMFGLRTKLVTFCVILLGLILEGYYTTVDAEQGNILLVFFIPCFMMLAGRWGDAHSLDRLNCAKAGKTVVDEHAPNASFLASRLLLVFLSGQFVLSGIYKLNGTWITDDDLLGNLMLSTSVDAAYLGLYVNPFAKLIADTPLLHIGLQWLAILFECFFFVCLFGRIPRLIVLSSALIFHTLNAYLMWVTFTNIMIAYAAFIDWQTLFDRLKLGRIEKRIEAIPLKLTVASVLMIAVLTGVSWNISTFARAILTIGGMVDFQTIWLPIPLIVLVWIGSFLVFKQDRKSW
jgi:hypothetical protein